MRRAWSTWMCGAWAIGIEVGCGQASDVSKDGGVPAEKPADCPHGEPWCDNCLRLSTCDEQCVGTQLNSKHCGGCSKLCHVSAKGGKCVSG